MSKSSQDRLNVPLTAVAFFQEGPGLRTHQWASEGMKVINVTNILGDGSVDVSNTDKYISSSEYESRYRHFAVEENDIVVASSGNTYGKVGRIRVEHLPLMMNTSVIRFHSLDKAILDDNFLYAWLRSPEFAGQVEGFVTGGAQPNFGPTHLKQMGISLPSIHAQREIANIISTYDDLIDNHRRRMALLEDSARQLYREWFVRLRFPGHEHTPIVDGVPQGWRKVSLTQITSKIGSGATPKGGEAAYQLEGVTLIRSMNVYDDLFDDAGLAFLNDDQAAGLANVVVEPNDILLNITGASVARCCMAPERYLPARVNQHVMIIRVDPKKANPFFVHKAINSDEYKRLLLSFARKGSTREALTKEEMANFEITIPTSALMEQFGEIAADAYAQREGLAKQNQKLRQARDLLLPRLMNGELAV